MMRTEIPRNVANLVKKQEKLIDEAIDRLNRGQISKFDRMQIRRALAGNDPDKQMAVAAEIQQKLLGPDYQGKAIKTSFSMLRELRELGLQKYGLYQQLIQPKIQEMMVVAHKRGIQMLIDILEDPELDKYGEQ